MKLFFKRLVFVLALALPSVHLQCMDSSQALIPETSHIVDIKEFIHRMLSLPPDIKRLIICLIFQLDEATAPQLFSGEPKVLTFPSSLLTIAMNPHRNTLFIQLSDDNQPFLFNLQSKEKLSLGSSSVICSASFSPDNTMAIAGTVKGSALIWNVEKGTLLSTLTGHTNLIPSVVLSPDNLTALTGSNDTTACLWNVHDGKLLHTLQGHKAGVSCVAFSPNNSTAATGSHDSKVCLWNVHEGTLLHTLQGHTDGICIVQFSPDGRTLLTGSRDGRACLWNARDGKLLHTLKEHTKGLVQAKFFPDGKTILTACYGNIVCLWHAETGVQLCILNKNPQEQGFLGAADFSPQGETIATAMRNEEIHLWDSAGHQLCTLKSPSRYFGWVLFSSDGKALIAGSHAGTDNCICIWTKFPWSSTTVKELFWKYCFLLKSQQVNEQQ